MILNPYQGIGTLWLRGSFHGHCSEHSACSTVPMASSLRRYRELGADFAAYTDHDHVTDVSGPRRDDPGLVLLTGFEHSTAQNLLFLGSEVPPLHRLPLPRAMEAADGLLTIVAHPAPHPPEPYWTRELLESLPRLPDGVEVFNGHYGVPRKTTAGYVPLYDTFWDQMLTAGHRLWGFANDDSHDPEDFGNAWNMVAVEAPVSAEALLEAARKGAFYATTGLRPAWIRAHAGALEVAFDRPVEGRFVGPSGRVLEGSVDRVFRHTLGEESYARFEARSHQGRVWLQPVFRSGSS